MRRNCCFVLVQCENDYVLDINNSVIRSMRQFRDNGDPTNQVGVGRFSLGYKGDNLFKKEDIVVYENTKGSPGPWQWLGWQTSAFVNQTIRMSVWLKFIGQVPKRSSQFGLKIYNTVYNDFIDSCQPNVWCRASVVAEHPPFGDLGHVILIFDSLQKKQKVLISKLKVEILSMF